MDNTPTTWQLLTKAWDWEPSVVIGCAALVGVYGFLIGPRLTRQAAWYLLAVLILLLDLVSPLDALSDEYLFSMHMLQHIVLVMVVPPLLLLGLPADSLRRLLTFKLFRRIERLVGQPAVAWLLGIGTLWGWHLPALYNAALANENVHILQHLMFLVTGTLFWWPVLAPPAEERLSPPVAVFFYLMPAGMINTLLGVVLTYLPLGTYPAYLHPEDDLHALDLIRHGWGLDPQADQVLGGALMCVVGTAIIVSMMFYRITLWFISESSRTEATVPTPSPAMTGKNSRDLPMKPHAAAKSQPPMMR